MVPWLLGLIMLGMGLTMSVNDFKLVLTRPKDVVLGIVLRYLIMPLIGFGVAKVLELPPALAAGLVLVGACPSGTASNVMAFLAKGDTALSVTVSSFNTILAPVLTPFIFLYLAGTMIPIQAGALLVDILKIVLFPIALGIVLRSLFGSRIDKLSNVIPAVSVISIILIIAAVVALNAGRLASVAGIAILAVILHNSLGLFLGYGVSRGAGLGEKKSRAISFEIGMENSGLAVALAMAHLDPMAAIPGAIFSVWHNFSGSLLAGFWGNREIKE
jgi:BASS family bile acid:Na+ symporter